jgi:cell division protein FtsX
MRGSTDRRRSALGAVIAATVTALAVLLFIGSLLWVMLEEGPVPAAVGIMIVYGLFGAAVVIGVFAAMFQRLREIRKGEEENARKY